MSDWAYYENLPPRLRAALAGAAFDYDAKQFYEHMAAGFTVTSLVNYIHECDLQHGLADLVAVIGNRKFRQGSVIAATGVRPLYR